MVTLILGVHPSNNHGEMDGNLLSLWWSWWPHSCDAGFVSRVLFEFFDLRGFEQLKWNKKNTQLVDLESVCWTRKVVFPRSVSIVAASECQVWHPDFGAPDLEELDACLIEMFFSNSKHFSDFNLGFFSAIKMFNFPKTGLNDWNYLPGSVILKV